MGMSDMLKDAIGYELSFVCFMPKDFPFKIDKCTKEKNDTT